MPLGEEEHPPIVGSDKIRKERRLIVCTEEEWEVIKQALIEEYERVKGGKGDRYGPLTLAELEDLIDYLSRCEKTRAIA